MNDNLALDFCCFFPLMNDNLGSREACMCESVFSLD
jgi:hypothetical protein